jgi:hypothetical protein
MAAQRWRCGLLGLVFKTRAFDRAATPPGAADAGAISLLIDRRLDSTQPLGEVAEWLKALAC